MILQVVDECFRRRGDRAGRVADDLELGAGGVAGAVGATGGGAAGGLASGGRGDGSCGWVGVEVGEDDALADGTVGGSAQGLHDGLGVLRAGGGWGDEAEAGDSAAEPEAGGWGEIGGGGGGGEGDEDTDAAAAGLMDELVEVVEGGSWRERGGQRGSEYDECVNAEGVQGIEAGGDGFEVGALLEPELFGGASAGWVGGSGGDLIEDGLTPPGVVVQAGACQPGRARVCAAAGRARARRRAARSGRCMESIVSRRGGPAGSTEMVRGAASLGMVARCGR